MKSISFDQLATSSLVVDAVYEEVRDDRHPIIFISGGDIAKLLISKGYKNSKDLLEILKQEFPKH